MGIWALPPNVESTCGSFRAPCWIYFILRSNWWSSNHRMSTVLGKYEDLYAKSITDYKFWHHFILRVVDFCWWRILTNKVWLNKMKMKYKRTKLKMVQLYETLKTVNIGKDPIAVLPTGAQVIWTCSSILNTDCCWKQSKCDFSTDKLSPTPYWVDLVRSMVKCYTY